MEANFRSTMNNNFANQPDSNNTNLAREVIAQHRNGTGSIDVNRLINTLKANNEQTEDQRGFIEQVDTELEKIAHPFDMARFREAFNSDLQFKDTLTYQGKPIVVGSAIDRTQQARQYADDALFSYRNAKGVVEITNEFAFIEPPTVQKAATGTSSTGKSADNVDCNKSPETWVTLELDASLGNGGQKNLSAPSAKLPIHDATTKSDAKFEIGNKGELNGATIQLTGNAENTIDEGSTHINEKGSFVTTYGVQGSSSLGLASIESNSKTTSGSLNAVKTEFELKTELHVDAKTDGSIGTKSTAEIKLNLLDSNFSRKYEFEVGKKNFNVSMTGEAQAGPAIKAEFLTGALAKKEPVNVEGSILRGKIKLEIESKNKNCE